MRAQAFVDRPKDAVHQHHESSPRQMLLILRQLSPPDSLWALLNWINGPPHDKVTLSLVIRIRNVDDTEAEFLLKSISHCRKAYTDDDVAKELSRLLNNANRKREFKPPTVLTTEDDRSFLADALLDCGCTDTAINCSFVEKEGIPVKKLPFPRNSMNADGTENKNGQVTHYVSARLDVDGHAEMRHLLVLDITCDIYIGFDWITDHNPEIDWISGKIDFSRCPPGCHDSATMPAIHFHHLYLRGVSMDLQIADSATKKAKTIEDLPEWIADFKDVFTPNPEDELPPRRPGLDHDINLKPDAPAVSPTKLIRMPPAHRELARKFVDDDLKAGLIRPSNSPYAAPLFFVPKPDGSVRPVLDY
jgi:hypothetical protein